MNCQPPKYLIMPHSQLNSLPTLAEGVQDFGIFKAMFMAGSPGSGKSTVRRELFGGLGLKLVDADEVRAAYLKLGKGGDYDVYGDVVRRQRQSYMDRRLGIIMDTTAWWLPSVVNTTRELQALGYDVGMVQVFTPFHQAMERVKRRAEQEGRDVPEAEVIKRYQALQQNTRDYIELFHDAYWFVDNSGARPNLDHVKRDIRSWLRQPPQSQVAQDWINQQRTPKQSAQ
jgi:predicted ABC-type ATPase